MSSLANWALFFLVNGLIIYSSYCLSGYFLRKDEPLSLLVVATGIIYFAHITLTVLFLGLVLQYLNLISVAVTSTVVSAALLYFFQGKRHPFLFPVMQSIKGVLRSRDYFLYGIILLFVIQAAILFAKVIMLPPHIWDVFVYHLTPAVEWYQQGKIPTAIDSPVSRMNANPLGMTVLNYWFFIFFRDDFLVELPQLLWALLLVPVTYSSLRQSEVSSGWSLKFSILVFFIPIVLMHSVTVKDHLGLNVGFIAALLFMSHFLKRWDNKMLLLAAIAFGLVLGYKLSGPLYPAVAAVILFYLIHANNKQVFFDSTKRLALLKTLSISVVIMIAIGGYWILRNMIYDGAVHGKIAQFTGSSIADLFVFRKLTKNIVEFFPKVFDYQSVYGADLPGISGFGPQFAAFGLPAMVASFAILFLKNYRHRPVNLFAWSALILLLVYMFFYYSDANYRVFSFFPMIMIAYAAVVLSWGGFFKTIFLAGTMNVIIVASILWNFMLMLPPHYTNLLTLKEFVSLDAGYRTSANYTRWFPIHRPSMYKLLGDIPANEPIAYLFNSSINADDCAWTYLYYDRNWKRKIKNLHRNMHRPDYLECDKNRHCIPTESMKNTLLEQGISLVSVCKVNRCLKISDPDFLELTPGLYYFSGNS